MVINMHWEILGISSDSDERTIKRKYAELIKKYNPEEYPEEFNRIRNAYKAAVDEAKARSENPPPEFDFSAVDTDKKSGPIMQDPEKNFDFGGVNVQSAAGEKVLSRSELSRLILNELKMLIKNECIDIEKWNAVLNTYEFDDLISLPEFRRSAMDLFFGKRFPQKTAEAVAAAFGGGSRAMRVTYPNDSWEIVISDQMSQKRTPNPNAPDYEALYKHGNVEHSSWVITLLKVILIIIGIFVGFHIFVFILAMVLMLLF